MPVTAIVPICVLALKWIVDRLAAHGLIPESAVDKMRSWGLNVTGGANADGDGDAFESSCTNKTCCGNASAKTATATDGSACVAPLSSEKEFEEATKDAEAIIVCKFTAEWCKPCHKIQPVFELWAAEQTLLPKFRCFTIDVDDFDAIASHYKVAMMPTFLVLKGSRVIDTYRGSHEPELRPFLDEAIKTAANM